jgi:hypothetical protein
MTPVTERIAAHLDHEASTKPVSEIARYLQGQLGQRTAAYLAGVADSRQIGRYAAEKHEPGPPVERRLREGYKVVRMICDAYDAKTAKAWLFGTNSRLDDQAPVEVIGRAESTDDFVAALRAARQFASVDG